jgi:hypothetical protein
MKKILSTIIILVWAFSVQVQVQVQAQTIHWLTFIDTTDPKVGQIDVYGRNLLYGFFINEVNAALSEVGYKSDIQDFYRYQVTPENCKLAVNMLKITNPEDIIVFYYIGHGGRPSSNTRYIREHPYPQMCLAQSDQNKFIPLEWVDSILSSKGARLAITLGMCCNSIDDRISIKDSPNFTSNYAPTYMSANKRKRIQELFLNTKGNVLATSASPGQTSGCVQIAPDNPLFPNPANYRDRYTFAIYTFFKTELDNYNQTLDWNDFLGIISKKVNHFSNGQQTPIHEVHTSKAKEPNHIKPKAPLSQDIQKTKDKQAQISIRERTDSQSNPKVEAQRESIHVVMNENSWKNDLTQYLTMLINIELSDDERQNLERELSSILFADTAKIRFLGQNSDTIIDRADASDWLGILATNPDGRILKVVVEEGIIDSNKRIKELKVREIYKQ